MGGVEGGGAVFIKTGQKFSVREHDKEIPNIDEYWRLKHELTDI